MKITRIENLAEELAKPEDVRLREVLDALDGRAVIFDGLGARVGRLLDEMDEWIGRAGEAERLAEERLAHEHQLQADIDGSKRTTGSATRRKAEPVSEPPLPPTSKSVTSRGELKDTPANRALRPVVTPVATFEAAPFTKTAFHHDSRSIIFAGDVRERLRHIAASGVKVDCIVTSPPFYGQRDYAVDGQIGLEEHPQQFLSNLLETFQLCWDVLSDTGSLWVNLGDTYWSGKGAAKGSEAKQSARRFGIRPQDRPGDGKWARPKQLLLIPHRFAIGMQDAGWLVRNDNVWIKPNPVPDQVRDRCSISHEHVFHFTKARWYYFNNRAVRRTTPTGRDLPPLDTWVVPPSRGNGTHKASFSEELVKIPILATTPPNGIVLDPFNGSGTSMLFAIRQGFRAIGIDLNEDYCAHTLSALRRVRNGKGV